MCECSQRVARNLRTYFVREDYIENSRAKTLGFEKTTMEKGNKNNVLTLVVKYFIAMQKYYSNPQKNMNINNYNNYALCTVDCRNQYYFLLICIPIIFSFKLLLLLLFEPQF